MEIEGRSVLVTGASRGIGRRIAEELLARGAGLVHATAPDPESAAIAWSDRRRVAPLMLDITDEEQVRAAADSADSPYSASKAAAHSLTQALRRELADQGIAVIGVYPRGINTDMLAGVDAPKADPGEVARAILDAVESGEQEDITPDQFCSNAYAELWADTNALERQLAPF